jgi:F0F1-type ATP synthase alpha subunit
VEFSSGDRGMCLNLEADDIGVSIFGNDRLIKWATPSSVPARLLISAPSPENVAVVV